LQELRAVKIANWWNCFDVQVEMWGRVTNYYKEEVGMVGRKITEDSETRTEMKGKGKVEVKYKILATILTRG
jgi:hypothetical protein